MAHSVYKINPGKIGSVTVTAASGEIINSAGASFLSITNKDASADLWVSIGGPAVVGSGILVKPRDTINFMPGLGVPQGPVNGISSGSIDVAYQLGT